MKRQRSSVEQMVGVQQEAEVGVPVAELIEDNARLKQLVAELPLDKTMLQDVLREKL